MLEARPLRTQGSDAAGAAGGAGVRQGSAPLPGPNAAVGVPWGRDRSQLGTESSSALGGPLLGTQKGLCNQTG